jgi:FXSXX-COOH protein
MDHDDDAERLTLPRLDELPLTALLATGSAALAAAARRVRDEADDRVANFAAFGNAP